MKTMIGKSCGWCPSPAATLEVKRLGRPSPPLRPPRPSRLLRNLHPPLRSHLRGPRLPAARAQFGRGDLDAIGLPFLISTVVLHLQPYASEPSLMDPAPSA